MASSTGITGYLGYIKDLPLFYIWIFILVTILIVLMIKNQVSCKKEKFTPVDVVKGLTEAFNPTDLGKKLTNRDIEKLACGSFNKNTLVFKYNNPPKIKLYKENWIFEQNLDNYIPEKIKAVNLKFSVKDKEGNDIEFEAFITIDGEHKEVNNKTKQISLTFDKDKTIEFYFDGIEQKAYTLNSNILINSITFNDKP